MREVNNSANKRDTNCNPAYPGLSLTLARRIPRFSTFSEPSALRVELDIHKAHMCIFIPYGDNVGVSVLVDEVLKQAGELGRVGGESGAYTHHQPWGESSRWWTRSKSA
jgi:hypothetical protein